MKKFGIFFISLFFSTLMLGLERIVGIGWDYHPDSVTYATNSTVMVNEILAGGDLWLIFNNGYYFLCHFLGENIYAITCMNIVLYSITNIYIYRFHENIATYSRSTVIIQTLALALLLFNPYRLHLSTTMLKDTLIILLMIMCAYAGLRRAVLLLPILLLFRIVSLIYFSIFLKAKYLYLILAIALITSAVIPEIILGRILEFNSAEMQLREFDSVPTFQSYGIYGALIRGALWPILAVSGVFYFVSPALAFFPVALGSIMTQIYCVWVAGRAMLPLSIYISMAAIAMMAPGFTAFIRYVYPLMVILPLVGLGGRFFLENSKSKSFQKNRYLKDIKGQYNYE